MATVTDARLTIAEAAARAGVSGHTLRHYERAGIRIDGGDGRCC
jgi:hypothetical protein